VLSSGIEPKRHRTIEQKKALYAGIAKNLSRDIERLLSDLAFKFGNLKKPQAFAHCGFRVRKLNVYEPTQPGSQS